MQRLLNQIQAAQALGISPRALERHRTMGTGPTFVRVGRLVRYREEDLTSFVESNLRKSTSEYPSSNDRGQQ